ncbi:hypothetical protein BE221DRAFT_164442, partial [Ostreococcus tauri]
RRAKTSAGRNKTLFVGSNRVRPFLGGPDAARRALRGDDRAFARGGSSPRSARRRARARARARDTQRAIARSWKRAHAGCGSTNESIIAIIISQLIHVSTPRRRATSSAVFASRVLTEHRARVRKTAQIDATRDARGCARRFRGLI